MYPVITWALGIGACVFGLGLISAIGSRRERKAKKKPVVPVASQLAQREVAKRDDHSDGMYMAAGGTGNVSVREDDFASISGGSR